MTRAPQQSFVYFIANEFGRVKIGHAVRPDQRLKELRTGAGSELRLLGTVPGGRDLEREWHEKFAAKRVSLEWFELDQELQSHIDAACSQDPLFAYHSPPKKRRSGRTEQDKAALQRLSLRIQVFLKSKHPKCTMQLVSQETGIKFSTIQKFFERSTCFSAVHLMQLTAVYGVEFLKIVCSDDFETPWVNQAYQDSLIDPEIVRARDQASWQRLHDEAASIMDQLKACEPVGAAP